MLVDRSGASVPRFWAVAGVVMLSVPPTALCSTTVATLRSLLYWLSVMPLQSPAVAAGSLAAPLVTSEGCPLGWNPAPIVLSLRLVRMTGLLGVPIICSAPPMRPWKSSGTPLM